LKPIFDTVFEYLLKLLKTEFDTETENKIEKTNTPIKT